MALDYPFAGSAMWSAGRLTGTRLGKRTRTMAAVGSPLLRRATPEDLEAIYRIETACFKERRFRLDHVDWILRNERAATFVVENGKDLLGAIMLLVEGQVARILSVATMPDQRRKHLGTEMMQIAEEEARRRGCVQVRLEVSTRNYGAIEFYRGLGYKTDGVLYGYYSWGEDAYSMIRSLLDDVSKAS